MRTALLLLCLCCGLVLGIVVEAAPRAGVVTDRVCEPIVLTGSDLGLVLGAALDTVSLWTWTDGMWRSAPLQIDERETDGTYARPGDDLVDARDEVVFTSDELGAEAPTGAWPPDVPCDQPGVIVRVTDPLQAEYAAYAYLFRTDGSTSPPTPAPRVSFDEPSAEIRTSAYTLGFARDEPDGFAGIKRLSLAGSDVDLLDRAKVRSQISVLGIGRVPVTEEVLQLPPGATDPVMRHVGPVRIVVDDRGRAMAYDRRLVVDATLEYDPLPSDIDIVASLRASLDLSPEAVPATYRDANVPQGVPVDGRPDAGVRTGPWPTWREMSFAHGRWVFVSGPADWRQWSVYYKDDSHRDVRDTGDHLSYGDHGFEVDSVDTVRQSGLHFAMVIPDAADTVSADALARHWSDPLQVEVATLPVLGSPTPSSEPATWTPEVTPSIPPTATPGATATPGTPTLPPALRVFLPALLCP